MGNCPLCNLDSPANKGGGKRTTGIIGRAWHGVQWLFPATLLALMPKCPLCVAMYVALFTGVGISVSTARWIQVLMVVLCVMSMGYLVVRLVRRRVGARGSTIASS